MSAQQTRSEEIKKVLGVLLQHWDLPQLLYLCVLLLLMTNNNMGITLLVQNQQPGYRTFNNTIGSSRLLLVQVNFHSTLYSRKILTTFTVPVFDFKILTDLSPTYSKSPKTSGLRLFFSSAADKFFTARVKLLCVRSRTVAVSDCGHGGPQNHLKHHYNS